MKKYIIIGLILMIILSSSKETIRFRVIANSNSEYDQQVKYVVKNELYNVFKNNMSNFNDIGQARNYLVNNLDSINNKIGNILEENNYDVNYNVNYGMNYFPVKELNDKIYEEGEYESLVVTLGDGLGDNFWCILFPPLCFMDEEDTNNVEYKSFFKEIFDYIFK